MPLALCSGSREAARHSSGAELRPGRPARFGDREDGQAVRLRGRGAGPARGRLGRGWTRPLTANLHRPSLQPRRDALARARRARDRGAGSPQPRRLEPLAAARRPRRPQPGPRLARARRGLLRSALGRLRRRRPVPAQPARRGAAAPLRERRPLRAPAAAHRAGARARLRQPLPVGRESVQAAREAALRQRQGGDRPPHRLAERLHPRRRPGDRARDLPLPPQLQRLERHRLQRARRQVRRPLRGPRRRPRPRRRRRPGAGLQLGDRRDRQHRATTRPWSPRPRRSTRSPATRAGSSPSTSNRSPATSP